MSGFRHWGFVCLFVMFVAACGRDVGTQQGPPVMQPAPPEIAQGNYVSSDDPNAPLVTVQQDGILLLDRCGDRMILDRIQPKQETWLGEERRGCQYHIRPCANGVKISKREYWDNRGREFEVRAADDYTVAITLRDRHRAARDLSNPLREESEGAIGRFFQAIFHYPIGRLENHGRPHPNPRHS